MFHKMYKILDAENICKFSFSIWIELNRINFKSIFENISAIFLRKIHQIGIFESQILKNYIYLYIVYYNVLQFI